ncbi:MAG: TerB family tellurite resistance protein [Rhodothermales bacterium]
MAPMNKTWTRAHDLALIYIALAYGTDQDLSEDELAMITEVLQEWRDNFPADEVQDVVMEAVAIYMKAGSEREVMRSINALKEQLSLEDRQRALDDVVRIAKADGLVLSTELDLIHQLAEAWEIRTLDDGLIDSMEVTSEGESSWSLLHDIGLMYLVVAHSSDSKITDLEIAAMIERLQDWGPEMGEEDLRRVLREALAYYSDEPEQEELQQSVLTVRKKLSIVHRLVLLDDLLFIAQSDGVINAMEKELLENLAQAWGVGIRLNGSTTKR